MHDYKVGDLVQLADVAARIARHPARLGTVVGFARPATQVKVLWPSADKPQVIPASLLQHAHRRSAETVTLPPRQTLRRKQQPHLFTWSTHEDDQLRNLLATGKGAAHAARLLARTERAVRARARKLGVASVRGAE